MLKRAIIALKDAKWKKITDKKKDYEWKDQGQKFNKRKKRNYQKINNKRSQRQLIKKIENNWIKRKNA